MKYLDLMRVKHYLKNLLCFLPIFFGGYILNYEYLMNAVVLYICFCFTSSIVYIINDYIDIEKDKLHPIKKNRPLASGKVKKSEAFILMLFLLLTVIAILYLTNNLLNHGNIILIIYLIINILYSLFLKNMPIIDITVLSLGFVLRVIYGGMMLNIEISNWLFLTVLSISYFMALGKRRNELKRLQGNETRSVLKYYTTEFLDKNMYTFQTLSVAFYSLWAINTEFSSIFKYSIILVIIIMLRYSNIVEGDSYGDPIDVILADKFLLLFMIIYSLFAIASLYIV